MNKPSTSMPKKPGAYRDSQQQLQQQTGGLGGSQQQQHQQYLLQQQDLQQQQAGGLRGDLQQQLLQLLQKLSHQLCQLLKLQQQQQQAGGLRGDLQQQLQELIQKLLLLLQLLQFNQQQQQARGLEIAQQQMQKQQQQHPTEGLLDAQEHFLQQQQQQKVFNANIGGVTSASSTVSSIVNSLANINLGENSQQSPPSGYQGQYYSNKPMTHSIAQTTITPSGRGYPMSNTFPMGQESYPPQTNPYTLYYGYTKPDYSSGIIMSSSASLLPNYGVQTLPGMPPLTVSATLPNAFPSQSFNDASNSVPNQSMGYSMDPNQTN